MKKLTLFVILAMITIVLSGCDEKYTVSSNIPDAENTFFTDSGRLFATGGTNIYEIKPDGTATALCEEGKYNFTGMAQVGNYLYAIGTEYRFNCSPASCSNINFLSTTAVADFVNCIGNMLKRSVLLCAQIVPGNLSFSEVYTIEDVFIPNGMVADNSGRLYIADETFLPIGKIIRLTLSAPMNVSFQETWLDASDDVYSPNGMAIRGDKIYFTDFNLLSFKQASIKTVSINSNGTPGRISTIFSRTGFFDDMDADTVYGTKVIVAADYIKGTLVCVKDNGYKQYSPLCESDVALFDCPSSVSFGKGPYYTNMDLIITEKGMMFEHSSNFGNKVSGMMLD